MPMSQEKEKNKKWEKTKEDWKVVVATSATAASGVRTRFRRPDRIKREREAQREERRERNECACSIFFSSVSVCLSLSSYFCWSTWPSCGILHSFSSSSMRRTLFSFFSLLLRSDGDKKLNWKYVWHLVRRRRRRRQISKGNICDRQWEEEEEEKESECIDEIFNCMIMSVNGKNSDEREKHDSTFRLSKISSSSSLSLPVPSVAQWQLVKKYIKKKRSVLFSNHNTSLMKVFFLFSPWLRAFFFSSIVKSHWKIFTKLVGGCCCCFRPSQTTRMRMPTSTGREKWRKKKAKCKWATCAQTHT